MRLIAVFLVVLCAAFLLEPSHAMAQDVAAEEACGIPQIRTDVRPKPHDSPTEVKIGAVVIDVIDISDVDQTIRIDIATRLQWTDPRLADFAGCRLATTHVWFPYMILGNSGRIFQRWPETVSVEASGKVTYMQRHSGTFSSYHNLEGFPFDTQVITLDFTSLNWSSEKLVFTLDETFFGISDRLNISDWKIHGVEATIEEIHIAEFAQMRSTFELHVKASRYVSYYFWKVLLPIGLIVVMSWAVFYVHPSQFGTQLGLSATSVLTMVAYIFATTNLLPRLGYFTLLDSFIATATIFVFVSLIQSLITGFLATRGQEKIAVNIDLISRVAFPAAFGFGCYYYFSNIFGS